MHPSGRTTAPRTSGEAGGLGCRNSCLIHLTILGVLGVAMLIWAVRFRAWELEVTVELPEKAAAQDADDAAAQSPSGAP